MRRDYARTPVRRIKIIILTVPLFPPRENFRLALFFFFSFEWEDFVFLLLLLLLLLNLFSRLLVRHSKGPPVKRDRIFGPLLEQRVSHHRHRCIFFLLLLVVKLLLWRDLDDETVFAFGILFFFDSFSALVLLHLLLRAMMMMTMRMCSFTR